MNEDRICDNCKWWWNVNQERTSGECHEGLHYELENGDSVTIDVIPFECSPDFGCNQWERKE